MLSKYSRSRLARPHTSFIPINSSREAFRIDRIVLYPSSVGLGASRLGREGEGLAPLCRRVRQPLNDAGNKRNPRASVGTTRQGRRFYSNWPAALLSDLFKTYRISGLSLQQFHLCRFTRPRRRKGRH